MLEIGCRPIFRHPVIRIVQADEIGVRDVVFEGRAGSSTPLRSPDA
ncbi:hypothetical protein [Natrialba chahannaoensis]|nr:hypothetical protein [Natrialba chahannaoensis]